MNHFTMQPSRHWPRPSTGAIICTHCLPRHGNSLLHVARLIDDYLVGFLNGQVLAAACESGSSPSDLDFVLSRTSPNWRNVVRAAAKGGHLHVFRWMREHQHDRGPWKTDFYDAIDEAARYGHLDLIQWLHEQGLSCVRTCAIPNAARHGHLTALKWLLQHTSDDEILSGVDEGMSYAAGKGHLATVQWIYENFKDSVDMPSAMTSAARNGDLDMLQWLHHQRRCSEACSKTIMDAAIGGGHFRVVEWLYQNCSQGCSGYAARRAAKAGNLPMLQWLHQHYNDRFGSGVMNGAASEGHLEMVKWLHQHRSEGCTAYAMDAAAGNGHLGVVRWLHANRTEGCTTDAMDGAARNGHLDVLKWLHKNRSEGCTGSAMYRAARDGDLVVVRWLVEHYPDTSRQSLIDVACWGGHFDVARYIGENTKQRASRWGLGAAMKQGWLRTQLVLMQNYHDPEDGGGGWSRLNAICKAFDKLLSGISHQHGTAASLLWREALESLELFHSSGFYACVSKMLGKALQRGYQALAQRFIEHRDESERCKYVKIAATRWNFVFLRWLVESGTPIDKTSAIQLATEQSFSEYVEVAGYLSECDRVQVVCEAIMEKKWSKLLQWTLEHTSFNDDNARATICNTIKHAPNDSVQWLRENLSDAEALEWCE